MPQPATPRRRTRPQAELLPRVERLVSLPSASEGRTYSLLAREYPDGQLTLAIERDVTRTEAGR